MERSAICRHKSFLVAVRQVAVSSCGMVLVYRPDTGPQVLYLNLSDKS